MLNRSAALLSCLVIIIVLLLLAIGKPADAKKSSSSKKSSLCNPDFFSQYHGSSDIFAFLDACADKYGAKSQTIGKSAEGKSLKVLTFGNGPREIFVMAGLHGREWIAPAATAWALYEIMTKSTDGDTFYTTFINENKVHVLALVNPDGYDYSRTKSETQDRRQWRKNRRLLPCKGERCAHGVDLNRNWGIEGKTFGFGATRPTSDVFQGKRPFSEPEIKAIRDWLLESNRGKHIEFVLDIHCCAQTVLPPSYYHGESAALKAEHLAIARRVSHAMTAVNQEQYGSREREQEFSATNSGISVDWIYGEGGVGLALIVETRGNEKNRKLENIFDVDPRNIAPIGGEVLAAIFAVTKEKVSNFHSRALPLEEKQYPETAKPSLIKTEPTAVRTTVLDTTRLPTQPVTKYTVTRSAIIPVDESEESDEEPAPEPLIVEESSESEEPPPPPGDEDEPGPPSPDEAPVAEPPGDESDEAIDARYEASRLRRHQKFNVDLNPSPVEQSQPPPSLEVPEEAAPNPSDEDKDTVMEADVDQPGFAKDSNYRQATGDDGHDDSTDEGLEHEDEDSDELDTEIRTILAEVKSKNELNDSLQNPSGTSPRTAGNNEQAADLASTDGPVERADERRVVKHDEGLLIIDEDGDENLQEDERQEEETEQITRRLRARINQLRAFRQQHPQSKWDAFKAKLKKGKWRAPLAFAFGAFVLWHFATKRNRVRRDD